jgi:tetratricopeptide (TPR) repeat protein
MVSLGRIIGKKITSKSDDAESYIRRGIKILEQKKLRPYYSEGYLYLGELYAHTGEYGKAITSLKKAETEYEDMEIDYFLSFTKSTIGMALVKGNPKQRDNAEDYIFQAIKIAEDHDYKPPVARGYLYLGELYVDSGQKEKALENLKKAEAMYEEMGMGLWLGKTKEILDRL